MKLRQLLEKLTVDIDADDDYTNYNFTDADGNKVGHINLQELYSLYFYFGVEDLEDEVYDYLNDPESVDEATISEIQDGLQTDDTEEMNRLLKFIDDNDSKSFIDIQKVFVEKEFRGNNYGVKMLKMVIKPNKNYILNASPEYDTSLSQITKMYKSVGFEELFDQGVNIIMVK